MRLSARGSSKAFTLVEVLVILVTLGLLAAVFIPNFAKARRQALAKACSNNLKMVGFAFRVCAVDSSGDWPMRVPIAAGGTKELVGSGQVFIHFRTMSNELATPKVLVCPQDKAKTVAKDFTSGFSDANVSYFVGTDAEEVCPQMFASGDRNLAFRGQAISPGLFVVATNNPSLSWTRAIHNSCGNITLADGSVQFYDSTLLRAAVQNQGVPTNRLAIP
jgi:competence protein ComGC